MLNYVYVFLSEILVQYVRQQTRTEKLKLLSLISQGCSSCILI